MNSSNLFPEALLKELGVLDWGYTEESVPKSFAKFEAWVDEGKSSPLGYLSDHRRDLRSDLKKVYPNFQSAVVFLFSYQSAKKWLLENEKHKVASYAFGFEGEDYHFQLRRRLEALLAHLKKINPSLESFFSLDAQPVLERDLAHRAGLGWFGKNSMLIHQKEGSYFLIGSLLLSQRLETEVRLVDSDHCGQCVACVDACPTKAIDPQSRTLVAEKCISTFTIETMKDAEPPTGFDLSRGEIFGCDICQDVCPWNKKVLQRTLPELKLAEKFSFLRDWFLATDFSQLREEISRRTNRGLKKKLSGTPFDRPGKLGWLKNLKAVISSSRNDS